MKKYILLFFMVFFSLGVSGQVTLTSPGDIDQNQVLNLKSATILAQVNMQAVEAVPLCQISAVLLTNEVTPAWIDDVKNKLLATGFFSSIDVIANAVPTLSQLMNYDAVLVWADTKLNNALGTPLAQYIDAGGGVVSANLNLISSHAITGTPYDANYLVMQMGVNTPSPASLGTILMPGHPIMEGVSAFSVGSGGWRSNSITVTSGSLIISSWSDGIPLVAVKENVGPMLARRADVNIYPVSSDIPMNGVGWDSSTDGARLFANALVWVSQKCECPDDIVVSNDPGQCGAIVEYDTPSGTLTSGLASGSLFPVGTTNVAFTNPDCSFTVTVNDAEPPVALCNDGKTMKAAYVRSNTGKPWQWQPSVDGNSNEEAMDAVFGAGVWDQLFYETLDPAIVFSQAYDFLFMEGGDFYADEMESFIDANIIAMESWVANGGNLFLNSAPNEGDGMNWGFGGVVLSRTVNLILNVVATDPAHPIFSGPFTPVATAYSGNAFAHAIVPDYLNQKVILHDALDPARHVLSSINWGKGIVFFGGMTLTDFHTPQPDAFNLRANMFSYLGQSKPLEFFLDEFGHTTVSLDDIDAGSWDNCGIQGYELDKQDYFTCEDVGQQTVTMTVTDVSGLVSTCSSTVTIIDNLPPTALCKNYETLLGMNGSVTITPEDIDGGSIDNCSFTMAVSPATFDCGDLGDLEEDNFDVTLTVTDASGLTDECTSVVTVKQRPAKLTYTGDLQTQYSDMVNFSALLVDEETNAPLEGQYVTFTIGTQSAKIITNALGIASAGFSMTQDPCSMDAWVMTATYEGECPFLGSSDEVDFTYLPEDAKIDYTGVAISATESMNSNDFTVTLRATIWEEDDDHPGILSKAKARFLVDGVPLTDFLPVILLDANDITKGMVEYVWEGSILLNPTTYDIAIELDDCYYSGLSIDYPLTVYNSAGDFITGGGYLIVTDAAAGFYAPSPESKLNFGFNVKFNKKGTNLQGKMNIIYRVLEEGEVVKVYQVKSNSIISLGTNLKNGEALVAEFVSKANLTDVTELDEFGNGVEIAGNLTLQVTMTDKGEPGSLDMIGFSLYNGTPNALMMASNWTGTKTLEQVIDGGNLVVHSGAAISTDPPEVEPVRPPKKKSAELTSGLTNRYEVYPNPFSESVMFEFVPAESVKARIDIYDLTGRMVKTVCDQSVEAGVSYNAVFTPEKKVSGFYFYRMTLGNEVFNGKVIYRK